MVLDCPNANESKLTDSANHNNLSYSAIAAPKKIQWAPLAHYPSSLPSPNNYKGEMLD